MHVIQPVLSAPVAIHPFGVIEPVASRPADVRDEHGEAFECENLDERHREPREVRTLLALRTPVDVVHERPRSLEAELGGRKVETRGHAKTVVRLERCVLAT